MAIMTLSPMVPTKQKVEREKMRTSPTGKVSLGFTLVEMLVVLTIIGLLSAMAIPVYAKSQARLRMWTASHELLLDLRHAHSEARTEKRTVTVTFSPEQKTYAFDDKKHVLGVDMAVSHEQTSGKYPSATPGISFYSDGSASPAAITLSNNDRRTNIHIDGLTGLVDSDAN
ncbi:MAG: GspH/FimT family pseudopilin [Alphaproteobacteria bacterium]